MTKTTITKLQHCFEAAMDIDTALDCAGVAPEFRAAASRLYAKWETRWDCGDAAY